MVSPLPWMGANERNKSRRSSTPSAAELGLDRVGVARRELGVPAVHRDLVGLTPEPEPGGLVAPNAHIGVAGSVDSSAATSAGPWRRNHGISSAPVGADGRLRREIRSSTRCSTMVRAHCWHLSDVGHEVGDVPLGTGRHRGVETGALRGVRECGGLLRDGVEVLVRLHATDSTARRASSRSASLLSGLFTARAHLVRGEPVVGCGREERLDGAGVGDVRIEPLVPHALRQHDRHPLVDRCQEIVRARRDDGARAEPRVGVVVVLHAGITPDLPEPRERERFTVTTPNHVGHAGARREAEGEPVGASTTFHS